MISKYIGIAGQKQNGKDELCQLLLQGLPGWRRRSWADALKELVCHLFKVDFQFIEKWKENPDPPPGFLMPMRGILQWLGDGVRQIQGSYWIDRMFDDGAGNLVIADTRYINELLATKKQGGPNVLIHRPGFLNYIDHPSEALIRPIIEWFVQVKFQGGEVAPVWNNLTAIQPPPPNAELIDYFILNDGSIIDLEHKVKQYLLPYLRERVLHVAA
jgi:hypothetical protein